MNRRITVHLCWIDGRGVIHALRAARLRERETVWARVLLAVREAIGMRQGLGSEEVA